jgi:hypothetical protein
MHFNVRETALYILGLYVFYIPFAYMHARKEGHTHPSALLSVILGYLVFFFLLSGAACILVGVGWIVDEPAQFCGSGCVEGGESHWQAPQSSYLLLGTAMLVVGWYGGKGVERFLESLRNRRPSHRPAELLTESPATDQLASKSKMSEHRSQEGPEQPAPRLDPNKPEYPDLSGIERYIEHVDLFTVAVKFAPEVLSHSIFQWHKTAESSYVLNLPHGEKITIDGDLLNQWRIKGKVNGSEFDDGEKDLETAFHTADNMLRFFGRNLIAYLRRDNPSKKGKEPATDRQKRAIAFHLMKSGRSVPDMSRLTNFEASKFLRKMNAA